MDDVIQLKCVAVCKYTPMNIYGVNLCSLLWNIFSLLNIYGDKYQSLRKPSSNMTVFISHNISDVRYWVSIEMIQFMERTADPG